MATPRPPSTLGSAVCLAYTRRPGLLIRRTPAIALAREILDEGRGSHAVGTVPAREPEAVGSRVQYAGSGAAASGAARDEDRIEQP